VAADESYDAAIGMCVVSDQALAIGVTAVPTPATDLSSDAWYLHQVLMGRLEFLTGGGTGLTPQMLTWEKFESRAMRKVEDGFSDIGVVETSALSSGCTVHTWGRQLIKLH